MRVHLDAVFDRQASDGLLGLDWRLAGSVLFRGNPESRMLGGISGRSVENAVDIERECFDG